MLSSIRRRTFQRLITFEHQGTVASRWPLVQNISCIVQQTRTARTKGGTNFYTNALRQDERLLRRLEAQLANAQAKLKREEAAAEELQKQQLHHGGPTGAPGPGQNHNTWFWDKVLSREDRAKLAKLRIHNFDALYALQAEAEAATKQPPYPSIDSLDTRLRIAYEIYTSIPQKVAGKKPSRFGWF